MITKLTIKSYLQLISLKKNYSVQVLFTLFYNSINFIIVIIIIVIIIIIIITMADD